jgi:hypothetical protein
LKVFISILSVFALQLCLGQTNLIKTNIDQSFLKPKWMNDYLKTTLFRNSDSIKIAYNTSVWYSLTNNDRPAVLITKNNDYLYNQRAISNSNGLCPYGFRIPYFKEIKSSKLEIISKLNSYDYSGTSIINKVYTSPVIVQNEGEFTLSSTGNDLYLATFTTNNSIEESYPTAIINLKSKEIESWPLSNNSGVVIKCVEDFNESLLNKEFEYRQLLPQDYENLISKISNILINSNCPSFNFKGNLKFNSNGLNVSDSFSKIDKETNLNLYNNVKNTISNWKTYPFYNDVKVKCSQEITIIHESVQKTQNEKKLFTNSLKYDTYYLDKSFITDLYKCDQGKRDFRYSTSLKSTKTIINNVTVSKNEVETMNKVFGKGPIYSVYSFIPGLGKIQITKNSEKGHNVSFSRKQNLFLGTSISLGIIAGASKLVSNYYYSLYRNEANLGGNYKIANISQKVFLSCLTAYSAMFVYDFSTTFALGIGNKFLQRKVNKKIRKLENPIIVN